MLRMEVSVVSCQHEDTQKNDGKSGVLPNIITLKQESVENGGDHVVEVLYFLLLDVNAKQHPTGSRHRNNQANLPSFTPLSHSEEKIFALYS